MGMRNERGAGNVGCIVAVIVLAVVVVIAVKAVPVKIAVAELKDFCEHQAEAAGLPRNTNEAIVVAIVLKAQELNQPVSADNIKVWRDTSQVHIEVKYRVVIAFPMYSYPWDVEYRFDRILF